MVATETLNLLSDSLQNAPEALLRLLADAMAKVQADRSRPKKKGRVHRV